MTFPKHPKVLQNIISMFDIVFSKEKQILHLLN